MVHCWFVFNDCFTYNTKLYLEPFEFLVLKHHNFSYSDFTFDINVIVYGGASRIWSLISSIWVKLWFKSFVTPTDLFVCVCVSIAALIYYCLSETVWRRFIDILLFDWNDPVVYDWCYTWKISIRRLDFGIPSFCNILIASYWFG